MLVQWIRDQFNTLLRVLSTPDRVLQFNIVARFWFIFDIGRSDNTQQRGIELHCASQCCAERLSINLCSPRRTSPQQTRQGGGVTAKSMTVPPQHRRVYYLLILVIYTASVKSAMYSGRISPLVVYSARRAVTKVNVGLEKGQLRTGRRTVKTSSTNSRE